MMTILLTKLQKNADITTPVEKKIVFFRRGGWKHRREALSNGGRGPPSVTWLVALFASQQIFSYICGKFEDYEPIEIPRRNADLLEDHRGGIRICR